MAAKIKGTAIVYWEDPNENLTKDMITINARSMVKTYTAEKLPIVGYWVKKQVWRVGDKLSVAFISAITTAAVAPEKGAFSIPITVKNTRAGGSKEEATVEIYGKYAFTEDIVYGTKDKRERILYYTCPEGMEFVLGHKRAFNSRLMLSLWANA